MDYIKPTEIVESMVRAGATKASLPIKDLLIRRMLSGALLGISTSLAVTATARKVELKAVPAADPLVLENSSV